MYRFLDTKINQIAKCKPTAMIKRCTHYQYSPTLSSFDRDETIHIVLLSFTPSHVPVGKMLAPIDIPFRNVTQTLAETSETLAPAWTPTPRLQVGAAVVDIVVVLDVTPAAVDVVTGVVVVVAPTIGRPLASTVTQTPKEFTVALIPTARPTG